MLSVTCLIKKRLMFLSGCLIGMSMPGYNFFWLAFFGFIPVLLSIFLSKNYKSSIINSYIFGFGFNLVALNWLLSVHPLYWLGLNYFQSISLACFIWVLISALCAVSFGLWGLVVKFVMKLGFIDVLKIFFISISWVILNNFLLSSLGNFSFPWTMIEYSQYNNLYFLQLASIFKGISLGFYLMIFNSAFAVIIFRAITNKVLLKKSISYIVMTFLCIGLFHGVGFWLYKNNKSVKIPKITLVQTNVSMEDADFSYFSFDNLKKYYTKRINQSPRGIVIFPESAIPDFINQNDPTWILKLQHMALKQDKTIIIGYLDKHKNKISNSAMIINNDIKKCYDKIYLVPFGETVPFEEFLPFDLKYFLAKTIPFRFQKGLKVDVIKTSHGNIAPSICYEIIFPELMHRQKLNNAELFVNISNLGWFRSNKLKEQFIAFAKMRAVENMTPVASSINTGFSFVVDSKGNILKLYK